MKNPTSSLKLMGEAFEGGRADYEAAKMGRFRRRRTGMLAMGSGADYHTRIIPEFVRMMEYARDMDRNDSIVGQIVDRSVLNIVQNGLTPDPQTGDDALNDDLKADFSEWANDPEQCDIAGRLTFSAQQEMAQREKTIDGDIFVLPLESGHLQMIEAHRVRTPSATKRNVIHGVLLDDQRRPEEYWITKEDIDAFAALRNVSDVNKYPARDQDENPLVFHVFDPKRVSQTRGITAFAPIFNTSGMFEDMNYASLIKEQVSACFTIFRKREMNFVAPGSSDPTKGAYGTTTIEQYGNNKRLTDNLSPGLEITGDPGEDLTAFTPAITNPGYFQHVRLALQIIGANLGLPLVMVLMDASDTNFSGWRGAIDLARMGFKRNQRNLKDQLCNPVYRWKLRQFIATDPAYRKAAAKLGKKFFAHRWNTPKWDYIQPFQDAQADDLQARSGLSNLRRIHAKRGDDYKEITNERIEDNAYAITRCIKASKAIEAETGEKIDWHELLTPAVLGPLVLAPAGAVATAPGMPAVTTASPALPAPVKDPSAEPGEPNDDEETEGDDIDE